MSFPLFRSVAVIITVFGSAACSNNDGPGPGTLLLDAGPSDADAGEPEDVGPVVDAGFGPCNPLNGSGCPGDGLCVWVAPADQARCHTRSSSPVALGAVCDPGRTGCEPGSTCVLVRGASEARCRQTCRPSEGNADCSGLAMQHVCVELSPSSGEYGICSPIVSCDPLLDACPSGETCSFVQGGALGCAPTGDVDVRGACSTDEPCQDGLICVNLGGAEGQKCFQPCDPALSTPECTAASTRCRGLVDQGFGICANSIPCNPLNDMCDIGQRCTLVAGNTNGYSECQRAGNVPRGGDCSSQSCQRGNVCVNVDGTAGPTCYEPCGPTSACSFGRCSANLAGFDFGICR